MTGKSMNRQRNAYMTDILRTVQQGKRRFLSLLLITVLGVTMFSGLQAACNDLRHSADRFFDQQHLHDLKILSTLGLTEEDLTALEGVDGVQTVQAEWSLEADTGIGDSAAVLEYRSFIHDGTDLPYVVEGKLPENAAEAAVTRKAAKDYDLSIGDTLMILADTPEEEASEKDSVSDWEPYLDLAVPSFTITAIVTDVTEVNNPFGSVSYRVDSSKADTVFVLPEAFEGNYCTSVLLRVAGADADLCYTEAYEERVETVKNTIIDEIMPVREAARTEQVTGGAQAAMAEAWRQYGSEMAGVDRNLAEAQREINDMKAAEWYLQGRESISGYANIESDADSIEAIGTVFPVVFFIVAILISLTTITRMVEEERSLIGTYKSLGFTDGEIRRKYLIYAGLAGIGGSLIGTALAFIGLPAFIFWIFGIMYLLPEYSYHFVMLNGLGGPVIFTGGILFACAWAVRNELKMVPASLMRPLAPKVGSRILLEKIRPLWQSFSFLQKVTARNLFRYKKRMLMTIFGIAGCTALMLFGFAIRDSVEDLSPRQYEQTFFFDVMSVAQSGEAETMFTCLDESSLVHDVLSLKITSADLKNTEGKSTLVTMMIIPDGESLTGYVLLDNRELGPLELQEGAVYVTRNAADVLELQAGDTAELKLADLQNAQIPITQLTENYLGNYLYLTESTYESYFTDYEINAALSHLDGTEEEQIAFADSLKEEDGVYSVTSIAELESQFSGAFLLINMVVVIVILMSAALAFVVLFTLASTNISERERELATIKVLGFFDPEVHSYVNRETVILSGIGILIGMPLGRLFAETLTVILNLPSIYLAVSLKPCSYLYALVLNVVFELIVNWVIGRTMDKIDPVEALKSVE